MNTTKRLFAVRGAVCCLNEAGSLETWVPELYSQLLTRNSLSESDIVSLHFSVTPDLTILNPATALRRAGLANAVPLFASAEPVIDGMLPRVIRILLTCYASETPEPVYLNGAETLRPDLFGQGRGETE